MSESEKPFDPPLNVGDEIILMNTKLKIEAVDGNDLICRNLNLSNLVTIPRQQVKLLLAEARFRNKLTEEEIREIEREEDDRIEAEEELNDAEETP